MLQSSGTPSTARAQVEVSFLRALPRLASRDHVLAVADQGIASAAGFAATVMIGRWGGAAELGRYALAVSLLVSLQAAQESLITLPYTILRRDSSAADAIQAGSALLLSVLLGGVAASLLTVGAACLAAAAVEPNATSLAWALCAVTPFVLLREFSRRFAFAHLRVGEAATLDTVAVIAQIVALLTLGALDALTAATACLALGSASGVAGVLWVCHAKKRMTFCARHVMATLRDSMRVGKWLFVNQIIIQVQIYAPYWLTLAIAGSAATGVLSACVSVVAFATPFVTGISNILMPRAVKALKSGGPAALSRQSVRDATVLCAITAAFAVLVSSFANEVMSLLFPGDIYHGLGMTVATLAMALVAAASGLPPANALASMERLRPLVITGLIGTVLTAALVAVLGWACGLLGIAYGVLAGHTAGSVARWTTLLRCRTAV